MIETVSQDSFEHVRFAFFTGSPGFSARHGAEARLAGATVIDLSGGLASDPGARPWLPSLDFMMPSPSAKVAPGESQSLYLAPSAPADVAVSLSSAFAPLGLERLVLSFMQPESERGLEGVDEMEDQVHHLLSFEPFGQRLFGAQVAFNMMASYGEESAARLADTRAKIVDEVSYYLADRAPVPAIFLVQAPVFYSFAFSAYAEFKAEQGMDSLINRIKAAGLKVIENDDPAPTNVSVAGEPRPVVTRPERAAGIANGIWIWGAADNLRVPAATAVTIAEKLLVS